MVEHQLDILENLLRLAAGIVFPHHPPVAVHGHHPGDEERVSGPHRVTIVADRRREKPFQANALDPGHGNNDFAPRRPRPYAG